eukprot:9434882-Pyramimonas_sp.AAC.1
MPVDLEHTGRRARLRADHRATSRTTLSNHHSRPGRRAHLLPLADCMSVQVQDCLSTRWPPPLAETRARPFPVWQQLRAAN